MTTHEACTRARGAFSDLLDRRDGGDIEFARAHLRDCAACSNYFSAFQETIGAARGLEPVAAPSGMAAKAYAAERGGAGGSRLVLWLCAGVAAAALAWFGLRGFGTDGGTKVSTYGGADTTTVVFSELPPKDRFLVVETFDDGGRKVVSLVDLQTMRREAVGQGGVFLGYAVAIDDAGVTLRSGSTQVTAAPAGDPAEAQARWARIGADAAQPADFLRLRLAALRGNEAALAELDRLAAGGTKWAGPARESLGGDQFQLLESLIRLAGDADRPGRVDSIRSLSRHGAPQVLAALRAIAREGEARAAAVAIHGLAELKDTASLPLLRALSASSNPDIARAAQSAVAKLLPSVPEQEEK